MGYFEYRDLAPIDNIENGDKYIEALNWAFQNKKVKNIQQMVRLARNLELTVLLQSLVKMRQRISLNI